MTTIPASTLRASGGESVARQQFLLADERRQWTEIPAAIAALRGQNLDMRRLWSREYASAPDLLTLEDFDPGIDA